MTVCRQTSDEGPRRLVTQYLEEARRVHAGRMKDDPVPIGDRPGTVDWSDEIDSEMVSALVEPYLFYVVHVASEFNRREVSFEDLLAEGNMGLVEAAHHYNPQHSVKFLTYATWWIRKRILEYLVREGRPVRLTRYARERRRDLKNTEERLEKELGRKPSTQELSEASGLDLATVVELTSAVPQVVSIERRNAHDEGLSLKECLVDRKSANPEQEFIDSGMRDLVLRELARLPEREQIIIKNRFRLDGREPVSFQDLGAEMDMSRERARQIERDGLERLRRRIHRRISVLEFDEKIPKRRHTRCRSRSRAPQES